MLRALIALLKIYAGRPYHSGLRQHDVRRQVVGHLAEQRISTVRMRRRVIVVPPGFYRAAVEADTCRIVTTKGMTSFMRARPRWGPNGMIRAGDADC